MTMIQTGAPAPSLKSLLAPALTALRLRREAALAALPPRGELLLLALVLLAIVAWGGAAVLFGYPAIILPALILVPTIFVVLLIITWG